MPHMGHEIYGRFYNIGVLYHLQTHTTSYYTGILLQNDTFHNCRNTFLQVEAPRQLSLSQKECPSVHPVNAVLLIPFV
jgi:hypothetical protein